MARIWKSAAFRYLLPFISTTAALLAQVTLQRLFHPSANFPFAFFYLVAAFVSAWYGGYVAGVLTCLLVMGGLPLLLVHFSHMPTVDPSRLTLLIAVSLMISKTAHSQREAREVLRVSNDELDRRVQDRTHELAQAVAQLQTEIAGHLKTEAARRESEERVQFALDAAGIDRLDLDLKTGVVSRSLRHDEIFGYDRLLPEWTYSMMFDHIVPEDRPYVARCFETATLSGSVCEFQCRIKTPDNSIRWISVRGRILRDESENAVSMLGIVADITDSKLAEHRLRTQLERLNLLDQITRAIGERQDLPSIFQAVVRRLEDSLPIDFGCVCLYDSAAEMLTVTYVGANSEQLVDELAMQAQTRIPIDRNGLSRCVRGHLVYEDDLSQVPFPFSERLARAGLRAMVAAPLLVESQVFGVLIAARREPFSFSSGECEFIRQVTEHVALAAHQGQIYSALQQAYEDLRQTQQTVMQQERLRALGQMASGIAHDINNAISPVSLYTESLLESEPGLSRRARQYLETIQRAIGDVARTVTRMREFYRQQEPQLVLEPVDLGQLVQQVLDLTRARWSDMAQQRGIMIDLCIELSPRLPSVAGAESEIREALINLIFNAVDAMPEGGSLTVRTSASSAADASMDAAMGIGAEIEVADTGVGMDEETRRRCLEPFFTTKGERGTGLGLAMVYGVMQRHNGQVEIESAAGRGTTMRLKFPPSAVVGGEIQIDMEEAAPSRMRILVVDDDPLVIKSLVDALESDGHVVTTANGGKEGIDVFQAAQERGERFAAVITDLGMPYVDGRKVASAVKAASPSTPVILLTGWGQRLVAEGGVPAHVDRVVSKPPRLRDLRAALVAVTAANSEVSVMAVSAHR